MKKLLMVSVLCAFMVLFTACSKENDANHNPVSDKVEETAGNIVITEDKKDSVAKTEDESSALTKEESEDALADKAEDATDETIEDESIGEQVEDMKEEIDYTGKKLIALSFDDGPNTTITPKMLDILEEHDAVATFFLIGQNINTATIKVMERQLELGCEIANHSWSHQNMSTLTEEQIKEEIQKTNDKIVESVGVTPKFFRPPFISVSPTMYKVIDLPFINGINCNDWTPTVTAEERANTIIANAKDGDIVLLHDFAGNVNTVDALDDIIVGLKEKDFAFVTISKLFELKGVDPNVENKLWTNTGW